MPDDNPYQPPSVAVHDIAVADPNARLYSLRSIGLATVLGSAFAGGLLMAFNYRALGQPIRMRDTLIWSFVGTVALTVLSVFLPDEVPNLVFIGVQLAIVLSLAHKLQGDAIRAHQARGAAMQSNWLAAGIALLVLAVLLAIIVMAALLLPASLLP